MTVQKKKKELLATRITDLVSETNENLLRVNLSKFFTDLEADIQKALIEYWSDTILLQGQLDLILAPIHEKHEEYYNLIVKHKLEEYNRAGKSAARVVKRQQSMALKNIKNISFTHTPENLFGTLKYSEDKLRTNTFNASENTLNRIDSNINQILTNGYREGVGINEVSRQISERFDQLKTWESTRIARTEIHNAQNMGIMNTYEELGVEYTQWIAASDDRTRESHLEIDREIIPFGGVYSNGLAYPGDTSGDISEWINCRCSNAPFVMPAGMMAPSFTPFREGDLIPIEQNTLEPIVEPPITEESPSMVQGNYETFTEYDKRSKSETTVYRFENGLEIGINAKAQLTFEEVKAHIEQLPEPLRNIDTLSRINICGHYERTAGGWFRPMADEVEVFLSAGNKAQQFDTLNHELAHALDKMKGGTNYNIYGLSKTEIYEDLFIKDNKLHAYVNEKTGRTKIPKLFPTDYAARSFTKFKKQFNKNMKLWEKGSKTIPKPRDFRFGEDFADSTKQYLNPTTHEEFIKKFPNRAAYLKSIYGKPVFNENSPHSLAIKEVEIAKNKQLLKQKIQEEQNRKFENLTEKEFEQYLKEVIGEDKVKEYYKIKTAYDRVIATRRTLFTGEPQFMIDAGYPPSVAIDYANNPNKYLNKTKQRYEKYKSFMDNINNLIKQIL